MGVNTQPKGKHTKKGALPIACEDIKLSAQACGFESLIDADAVVEGYPAERHALPTRPTAHPTPLEQGLAPEAAERKVAQMPVRRRWQQPRGAVRRVPVEVAAELFSARRSARAHSAVLRLRRRRLHRCGDSDSVLELLLR